MGKGDLRWEYVRLTPKPVWSDEKCARLGVKQQEPRSYVMPVKLANSLRSREGRVYDNFREATITRASREEYIEEG